MSKTIIFLICHLLTYTTVFLDQWTTKCTLHWAIISTKGNIYKMVSAASVIILFFSQSYANQNEVFQTMSIVPAYMLYTLRYMVNTLIITVKICHYQISIALVISINLQTSRCYAPE